MKSLNQKTRQNRNEYLKRWRKTHPKYSKQWRQKNLFKWRQYNKEYCKTYYRQYGNQSAKIWALNNPEKIIAQSLLNVAVKQGKIKKQPCYICGNDNTIAHHNDYKKPLNVLWLCRICHYEYHHKKKET